MAFQDSNSPMMFYIRSFHDHVMVIVIMILSLVIYIFLSFFLASFFSRFFYKSESLEILWTILPCMVLGLLGIPSLLTLYMVEEMVNPNLTIKVIGHQWYWSYEYEDFEQVEFDSYMIPFSEMKLGNFRLLEVTNNVVIPVDHEIRIFVTSTDVIHSWTIPSLGLKVDCIPGRLNQLDLLSNRVGLVYGQCSEICGSLHSFMPICLEMVPLSVFLEWIRSM